MHVGMTEASRIVIDEIFLDETVWRNSRNLGEKSFTIFEKSDEFRTTGERLTIHVFANSRFMMSKGFAAKKADAKTISSMPLGLSLASTIATKVPSGSTVRVTN